ncbi:hypothetical protein AYK24_10440 [Thermoplasmatales archaeon SG8-52-4]|nr:MAG: hypothetical protein AYK24_10440 [Thermoplasmatales archaeon SG8-52-4]
MFTEMKKNKKSNFIIIGILITLIVSIFSGCINNSDNNSNLSDESKKFVGTWKHGTSAGKLPITFSANGNCDYEGEEANWEIKNGKLVIYLINKETELVLDYNFLDNNQILELTNNNIDPPQIDDYKKQ